MDDKKLEENVEIEIINSAEETIEEFEVNHVDGTPSYNETSNRTQVNEPFEKIGEDILTKVGVPKPISTKAIKTNGGIFSPTNMPGNKVISNFSRNRLMSNNGINKQDAPASDKLKEALLKKGLSKLGFSNHSSKTISKVMHKSNGIASKKITASIKINVFLIGGVIALLMLILVIVVIMVTSTSTVEVDESYLSNHEEVTEYLTGNLSDEDFSDVLVSTNICSFDISTIECLNTPAGQYFKHIKELYKTYSNYTDINGNAIELDTHLLLETISYNISDIRLFDESNLATIKQHADNLSNAMVEKYQEKGDLYYEEEYIAYYVLGKPVKKKRCLSKSNQVVYSSNGQAVYYRISDDKYVSYLKYGEVHENYKGEVKVYDVDIHPDSDSVCIPSGRMYQSSDVVRYVGH